MTVTRAEVSALREADRTNCQLAEVGVHNQLLVVNGVFDASDTKDPYAVALQQRGAVALAAMPDSLKTLPQAIVPLSPDGFLGIDALRGFGNVPGLTAWASPRVQPQSDQNETDAIELLRASLDLLLGMHVFYHDYPNR